MRMGHMIFVDWGTTSFRAYLVGPNGSVLEVKASDKGVKASAGRFEEVLQAHVEPWFRHYPVSTILCAGMVGSDLGWRAVSMIACPADVAALALKLCPLTVVGLPRTLIVPGISCTDSDGSIGMMRGEEVLLFGSLAVRNIDCGRFCFPGTHSKWVTVSSGAVRSIRTCMTGECFALLRTHSVLARSLEEWSGEVCEESFLNGVSTARQVRNPLQSAFAVRALHVHGHLTSAEARASYLSGILIGTEVAGLTADWPEHDRLLTVVCEPRLAALYEAACRSFAIDVTVLEEMRCFVAGGAAILRSSRDIGA
jgi:2-dehydro-3-deoxygalactonokinase